MIDASGHSGWANRVLYWPYRNELITVSNDKSIRFWSLETGEPTRTLRPPIDRGEAGRISAAALSTDNKLLAVGGDSALRKPGDHAVYLIDPLEGKIVRTLAGHPSAIRCVAFAPDGKTLATACYDEKIRLFDVATGSVRYLLGHSRSIVTLDWSPDGRSLVSGSWDNTARIWDAAGGTTRAILPHSKDVLSVCWSPDGRTIATGCSDQVVRLWNPDGSVRFVFPAAPEQIEYVYFSPNSLRLLYGWGSRHTPPRGTAVIDLQSGRELSRYMEHLSTPLDGIFLPDGRTVATVSADGDIVIWDSNTGTVNQRMLSRGGTIFGAGWSRDDRAVGWAYRCENNTSLKGSCALEHSFCLGTLNFGPRPDGTFQQAIGQAGGYDIQRTRERVVTVWQNGGVLSHYQIPHENDKVRSRTLLSGDRAAIGCSFGLYIIDIRTGRGIYSLPGHTDTVYALAPSISQRYLLSGARDHTLEIWNMATYEHLASLFFAGNEWIVWTPQGYYAASVGGEALMGWHVNQGPDELGQFYPASRFRASHYRPDVIRSLLETQSVQKAVTVANSQRDAQSRSQVVSLAQPPQVVITSPRPGPEESVASPVTITATAKPNGNDPILSLSVLVNGRPGEVRRPGPRPESATAEVTGSFTLTLPPGRHQVAVRADTVRSYDLSAPLDLTIGGEAPAATLYVLAIGADQPGQAGPLAKDAGQVAAALQTHAAKQYSRVLVKSYAGPQATLAGVHEGLDWLAASATPSDAAIVYFAATAARGEQGTALVLAGDALHPASQLEGAEFASRLARVRGRLMLWADWRPTNEPAPRTIRDYCLGQISETSSAAAAADDMLRDLVAPDQGVAVISANSGTASAAAPPAEKTGWFAQAIVEGLGGKADVDQKGVVSLMELEEYVKRRVAELSSDRWRPTVGRSSLILSIPLTKP